MAENYELYRAITDPASKVIWKWNYHTNEIVWSDNFSEYFGWLLSSNKKLSFADSFTNIHQQDYKRVYNGIMEAIHDPGQTKWQDEFRFQKWDWDLENGMVYRDAEDLKKLTVLQIKVLLKILTNGLNVFTLKIIYKCKKPSTRC